MTTKSSKTGKTSTKTRGRPSEFRTLWKLLPHPPGSVVRLFARGGDFRDGDYARKASEIRRFAETYAEHNIYVAPNPTNSTEGSRHSAKDVTHWSYFLIDMDPIHPKMCNPEKALLSALRYIGGWTGFDFEKTPPIIIDSGRGMQAWIRLDDYHLVDESSAIDTGAHTLTRSMARKVHGYWLKRLDEFCGPNEGCRIDTSVSDLPRVMRCPGTINQKTGRKTRIVVPSQAVFSGFADVLIRETPSAVFFEPEPIEGLAAGAKWQDVFVHLTRMAQDYLTRGQAEPGRHKVMWHTAKKLRELGVTRSEASKALRHANKLQGKDEELPLDQVKHALATAYDS